MLKCLPGAWGAIGAFKLGSPQSILCTQPPNSGQNRAQQTPPEHPQISRFAAFCGSTKRHVICVLMGQVAFPCPLGALWFLFPRLGYAINTQIEAPELQIFSAVFAHSTMVLHSCNTSHGGANGGFCGLRGAPNGEMSSLRGEQEK